MVNVILLILGLGMILYGASILTDGSSALAKRFGISDLVVGLTVVAFGTSAPELTVSVVSAIGGQSGMAVGNVVGSNIFNTLMIVGCVALCRPLTIERSIMANEMPLVILASLTVVAIGLSPWLDGSSAEVTRVDGIFMLLFFCIFMRYVFSQAKNREEQIDDSKITPMPLWKSSLYILGGLALLIFGGDIFVDNASALARNLGVSEAVIGLTIVAMGTSLPELATSVTAAVKGVTGLAVGNVIGSNIFNIFFVLGASATISPLPFAGIGTVDVAMLLISALLFWLFGWKYKVRTITRVEGGILVAVYLGYIAYLVANAI